MSGSPVRGGRQTAESRRGHQDACAPSSRPGRSPWRTRCAGVKDGFPNTENIQVNGDGRLRRHVGHPGQAVAGQGHRLDHHPRCTASQVDALRPVEQFDSPAKVGTFDLSPEAAQAVKAGKIQFCIDQQPYLQGYMAVTQLYLYKKNGNDPRWRQAVADRPVVRRQHQRRHHLAVHQPEHPLVLPCPAGRATRFAESRCRRLSGRSARGPHMSQTVKTPPAATPSEASNRVTLGLSNRLLGPARGRGPRRRHRDLHLLPDRGALLPFAALLLHRALPGLDHRHRRRRRRHADDRWRVRSVRPASSSPPPALFNAMFCYQLGINLWVGAIFSLILCLAIGFFNGYLVMRTGIPSS